MNIVGIDLGIGKVACSVYQEDEAGMSLIACPWLLTTSVDEADKITARARQLHEIGSFVYDTVLWAQAGHVFVESVIMGNNHKYSLQLAQTLGSILSGLHAATFQHGTRLHLVDNKAWKKRVVGNGNATKDQIKDYIDVTHPSYALLCEGDQDRYDACCIGLYGVEILEQSKSLSL